MSSQINRYFRPGIQGPQVDTPYPRGGIGMPVEQLYGHQPWDSPGGLPATPHNLPAPGDRLNQRRQYPIGAPGGPVVPGGAPAPGYDPMRTVMVRERHRYAQVVETPFPIGLTSFQVLAQPTGLRNFLLLRNISTGAELIYISFGNDASINSPLRLTPGQSVLFDTVVPQNEINAISDLATGALMVAYAQYAPT